MKVCLLPTDTWGVGSYRCLLPGRELERHGHEVFSYFEKDQLRKWRPGSGNVPLRNSIPILGDKLAGLKDPKLLPPRPPEDFDADVYVFQRRLERWMPFAVARLRDLGKTVVSELDDLYDDLPETSPGRKPLDDHADVFSVHAFNRSLHYSDAVTVSTPALAEHYSRYNDNVRVLPNYLDGEQWKDVQPQYDVERHRIRIGWMGWLDWRDSDLAVLREFLRDWLLEHPNVEFVSIGERKASSEQVHKYLGIPRSQRVSIVGVPFQRLPEIVATIDIGLVPLTLNHFNECKSYLKGLEYAAAGIPCIASPTQQYREFVREGHNGFLATTADEWRARLDEMVGDDDLRRTMGRNALRKAKTMTIEENWQQWETVYTDATLSPWERMTASTPAMFAS